MKKEDIRSVGWLNCHNGSINLTICFHFSSGYSDSVANVTKEQFESVRGDEDAMKQLAIESLTLEVDDDEPARRPLAIGTRAEGIKIAKANNAKVWKYCTGKYKWHGSAKHYIGREEVVDREVLALWVERRSDRNGPYAQIMCASIR
ncbi:DUF987 family protein [Vibrio parahaemolyticus]|nr:DUF987 family protein [Vibrio parahaemolyticus]